MWGLAVGLIAAALLLAACGSDSDSEAGSSSSSGGGIETVPAEELGGQRNAEKLKDLYRRAVDAGQTTVTIYGGTTPAEGKLFKAFTNDFPEIEVHPVAVAGAQMAAKVNAEFSSGKRIADLAETEVLVLLDFDEQHKLVRDAVFTAKGFDEEYVGPHKSFYAASLAPFGVSYNTNLVEEGETPKSWHDLLHPRWKGQISMGNPTVVGPAMQVFASMLYSGDYTPDFFRRLYAQDPQVAPPTSPAGTTETIAQGARRVGVPASQKFTVQAADKGAPIGFSLFERDNYVTRNAIGLIKDAPHELAARLYMNWLFTPRGGAAVAKNISAYSPVPGSPPPPGLPPLDQVDRLPQIPVEELAEQEKKAISVAQGIFR